mgnify:CR=1 FL=1
MEPNRNISGTKTLPYRYYTDPNVLKAEQKNIFSKSWQFVCHENRLKQVGDFYTCEIASEPIMIVRGEDGTLRAFYNVCPHRATRVENSKEGNKKILQCPYHGWTFHLDGGLHKAPNFKNAEGFDGNQFCLRQVCVEVMYSLVFVNLDPAAETMSAYFQDFTDDFSQFQFLDELKENNTKTRTLKCNWKTFIDNFLECDHCPIAHPGFADTLDLKKYQIINGTNCNIQGSGIKEKKGKNTLALNLDGAEVQEGRFYWLWPNLMLTVYPGPGNLSTIQMIPIDENTTLGIYTNYSKNEEPTEERKIQMAFAEQVREEDAQLVELEQIGFRSSAGPFRSFAKIAVEPRPYQLVPLLMALKLDPVRLLIADDVGIGKTVEACLIARELLDRGEITRIAVLCPPHLAEQWQIELRNKFHIDAELVLPSTVTRLERNCGIGESLFEVYPFEKTSSASI